MSALFNISTFVFDSGSKGGNKSDGTYKIGFVSWQLVEVQLYKALKHIQEYVFILKRNYKMFLKNRFCKLISNPLRKIKFDRTTKIHKLIYRYYK
jgi:hypothetical protein